jgi:hypothetical protein
MPLSAFTPPLPIRVQVSWVLPPLQSARHLRSYASNRRHRRLLRSNRQLHPTRGMRWRSVRPERFGRDRLC